MQFWGPKVCLGLRLEILPLKMTGFCQKTAFSRAVWCYSSQRCNSLAIYIQFTVTASILLKWKLSHLHIFDLITRCPQYLEESFVSQCNFVHLYLIVRETIPVLSLACSHLFKQQRQTPSSKRTWGRWPLRAAVDGAFTAGCGTKKIHMMCGCMWKTDGMLNKTMFKEKCLTLWWQPIMTTACLWSA